MTDAIRKAVFEHLLRPSLVLIHPNDVVSHARAALAGYVPDPGVSWTSDMSDYFLTDPLLATIVSRSHKEADMWDACVHAVECFAERQQTLPPILASWNLEVLKGHRRRPTNRGGPTSVRTLRNIARDMRIAAAVDIAARIGELPEFARRSNEDADTACSVVSECLIELDKQGDAAGADIGYEAVKKIWLRYREIIRSDGPAVLPMGTPIE